MSITSHQRRHRNEMMTYESILHVPIITKCGRLVFPEALNPSVEVCDLARACQRMDIGVVTYEAMTPYCGRSVVQILVVRVDIGVVIYEAMTPQCGRSVVQVLVIKWI